jgi:hypothetical protein
MKKAPVIVVLWPSFLKTPGKDFAAPGGFSKKGPSGSSASLAVGPATASLASCHPDLFSKTESRVLYAD